MEEKFYFCDSYGNLMVAAIESSMIPYSCDAEMILLIPNITGISIAELVSFATSLFGRAVRVNIGSVPHPKSGLYNAIYNLETWFKDIMRYLQDNDYFEVIIYYAGKTIAVYVYCNINGRWSADVPGSSGECAPKSCLVM